jgi:hypothetical protein
MHMTAKIFISYRRIDSEFITDIIYHFMATHFGKDNVFLDVGSIPIGVDFRDFLRDQIAAHDVILVIIGPEWERVMRERADESNDFVRIEIENALKLGKLVIPVRVMNADIPNFKGLPESIHDLQWRNGAVVRRQPDLENDCTRLAEGIRSHMGATRSTSIEILPQPFAWIEIPGKGYSIAKYPVTNAQFAIFVETGGYRELKWWTDDGCISSWCGNDIK